MTYEIYWYKVTNKSMQQLYYRAVSNSSEIVYGTFRYRDMAEKFAAEYGCRVEVKLTENWERI